MATRRISFWLPLGLLGCVVSPPEELEPGAGTHGESGGASEGGADTSGDGATTADETSDSGDDTKLDVASHDPDGGSSGCKKIDFLFVVDDSGSMSDEQQNLAQSVPGFIATIKQATATEDYHVMVVDTSAGPDATGMSCGGNECTCLKSPLPNDHPCCFAACDGQVLPGIDTCDGVSCDAYPYPKGCDATRGAGRSTNYMYEPCGFASGARYMDASEPDLAASFECAAIVGINAADERPMDAMTQALGPLAGPGECNDGFLRDDAILVVTVITDEDDEYSAGTPAEWKQAVVDAKLGDESALVVLGLLGDPDVQNGVCQPMGGGAGGADASVTVRAFVESLQHGLWGSVCLPDYSDFLAEAVALVKTSCDEFVPEG